MNRLDVSDVGGFPVVLDDLDFLQDAFKGAFEGIGAMAGANLLAADGFIISGCEKTSPGGVTNIAAGFIYLKGEVFKVDAHVTVVPTETEHWVELETDDAAGNKVFQDTVSHQTYKVRKAHVLSDVIPPGDFMPVLAQGIGEVIGKAKGADTRFIMAFASVSSTTYNTTEDTVQTLIPSATLTATLGFVIWQFHINLAGGGGTGIVSTFKIKKGVTVLQTSLHSIVNDGASHIITVIALTSYTPGTTFFFTAETDTLSANYLNGTVAFMSLTGFNA